MPIVTSFNPNGRQEIKQAISYPDYALLKPSFSMLCSGQACGFRR